MSGASWRKQVLTKLNVAAGTCALARARAFQRDQSGAVIIILATALPVLAMATLGAVEVAEVFFTRTKLQPSWTQPP